MFADPTISDHSVVTLDISVLLWVARLNVFDTDILCLCPIGERMTDKLRAVIATNHWGDASLLDQLVLRSNNAY